ncbi:MAG TPA: UDPGP type 1 family protein [Pirellulales bacterium]|nr:UDPGP type 1 family protein [Pirellulales bacterium]
MNDELAGLRKLVAPYGQEHLLAGWDSLSAEMRRGLAEQIRGIDFARIERLLREQTAGHDWAALARRALPPPAVRLDGRGNSFSRDDARGRGEELLRAGRVGVVLVAGGQGTRLGFDHPKGCYPIGPVSQATLFQILLEKVLAVGRRYGVSLPLYLMTSPATHEETIAFLVAHKHFGLPAADVTVFCQGTMPAVDATTGKVLQAGRGCISLSPDGHGGMPAALRASGALADIRRRGIKQLFYMQVDNPLVGVCDPEFIGYHLLAGSELSTQVVAKHHPLDRVGNVVSIDGQVRIIEYSDLPDDVAQQRLTDGSLKLWAGNIAVHVFDVDLLDRASQNEGDLPFHLARKKVPYLDDGGRLIEPAEPNAIKFEQFIFDLLPAARQPLVVEVDEAACFAPVKNALGAERDSPEKVQAQMIALHRSWLEQAGANIAPGVPVEISPLFALDAKELRAKPNFPRTISERLYLR